MQQRNLLGIIFFLIAFFPLLPTAIWGQHSLGIINSNNTGVLSVTVNPANIADSRFWLDVHLFSFNLDINQNLGKTRFGLGGIIRNNGTVQQVLPKMFSAGKISPQDYLQAKKDIIKVDNFNQLINRGVYGSVDIMGPSIMFNVLRKVGMAITTRARANIAILDKYSGNLAAQYDQFLASFNRAALRQSYKLGNITYNRHFWAELGFTVATPIMEKGRHFLKGGITFKRLVGYSFKSFRTLRAQVDFNPNEHISSPASATTPNTPPVSPPNVTPAALTPLNGNGNIALQGYLESLDYLPPSYKFSGPNDILNYYFNGVFGMDKDIPTGWGFDVGFVYEYRPHYEREHLNNAAHNTTKKYIRATEDYTANKYKVRWSIALKDFGYVRYKKEYMLKWWYNAPIPVQIPTSTNPNSPFVSNFLPTLQQVFSASTSATKFPNPRPGVPTQIPAISDRDISFYLPATFVTQLDINVLKNLYVNASFFANLATKFAYLVRTPTLISLAASYETNHFDIAMPFTYNIFYHQLKVGLGFNIRQIFFLGTDDIAFLLGGFRGLSLYTGFRVPMRKRKPFTRVLDNTKHYNPIYYKENPDNTPPNPYRNTFNKNALQREHIPDNTPPNPYRNTFNKNALQRNNKVLYNEVHLRNDVKGDNVQTIKSSTPPPKKRSSTFGESPL